MYVLSNSVWKQLSQFPWSLSVCKVQRGFSYSNTSRCLPMFQLCFHQIMPKILNAWCCCCNRIASLVFRNMLTLSLSFTPLTEVHDSISWELNSHEPLWQKCILLWAWSSAAIMIIYLWIFLKKFEKGFLLLPHPIPAQMQTLFHKVLIIDS